MGSKSSICQVETFSLKGRCKLGTAETLCASFNCLGAKLILGVVCLYNGSSVGGVARDLISQVFDVTSQYCGLLMQW